MLKVAVYDSKPYDRQFLGAEGGLQWHFLEARLEAETAGLAAGCGAACVFVNDQAAARRLGLALTRVPAYSPHAVAEHSVALLLSLNRRIHRAYRRVLEHDFRLQGLLGHDLHGRSVGIVGTGRIGRLTAQIYRGFGCRVLAHDPKPQAAWARAHGVRYVTLAALLKASDVVSLHAPLTPRTAHMIDAAALARMKPGAYLVNTGRGRLIDTRALIQALKAGRLGGVALDVYEEEEGVFFEDLSNEVMADDLLARLLSFPTVLMTAHQAFFTGEALAQIAKVTAENLRRLAAGRRPLPGTAL